MTTPNRSGRLRRRIQAVAGGMVAAVVLMAALNAEVRDTVLYAVAPAYARDRNFRHLSNGTTDVHLLGTIHGRHLDCEDYGLAHLEAVLTRLHPDLLLLEMRPEEVQGGRIGDGPVEMPFAALAARSQGLRVDGIDWWLPPGGSGRRTDEERDDRIFANLAERLPARGMVLVLIGYSHVPEQAERLERAGFVERDFQREAKARLFEPTGGPFRFPAGMQRAIRQRIEDAEAEAQQDPGAAEAYRAVAASRRELLKVVARVGEVAEGGGGGTGQGGP